MMKPYLFLLLLLAACTGRRVQQPAPANNTTDNRVCRMLFGKFCGHCIGNCTTIYAYSPCGTTASLAVDRSNGFFKDSINPSTSIQNSEALQLAEAVYRNLPQSFLSTAKTETQFGCPDCADQCGYYVELEQAGKVKKFRIDTQEGALEGDVKNFASFLSSMLQKMDSLTKR